MEKLLKLTVAVVLLLALIGLWNCRKMDHEIADLELNETLNPLTQTVLIIRGGYKNKTTHSDKPMVLGKKKTNPYNVSRMTDAWNNLYPSRPYSQLPVTHLYVRFLPQSFEHMAVLDSLELHLLDFPMDYEIAEEGDYYKDPAVSGDFTWLYGVVPSGFSFPAVPYEVLDQLHLAPYDSYLAAEAFRLAGQPYDRSVLIRNQPGSGSGEEQSWSSWNCAPGCPGYPCCLSGQITCQEYPLPHLCDSDDPDCHPGAPGYPECLGGGDTGGGGTALNACGCAIPANNRTPEGCVQVVDTQLPDNATINNEPVHVAGVRNVRITWWDGWFTIRQTQTNENGCLRIDGHRAAGRAYMWVVFRSERVTIRGIRGARIWEYSSAVKDQANFNSPPCNNIRIVYFPENDDAGSAKAHWYAATANNALYEYDAFAQQDGILPPANGLKILLTNYEGAAAAPMLEDLRFSTLTPLLAYLTSNPLATTVALLRVGAGGWSFLAAVGLQNLRAYLFAFAPDIVYNYGEENFRSDRIKRTFYHEYGHASHFRALNNDSYWVDNILYIVENVLLNHNPPYGNGTRNGAPRCAVIEMWGGHIGFVYADRQYGLFHSNANSPFPAVQNDFRHIFQLERFNPNGPNPRPFDEEDSWIPSGLFWDLIDHNGDNPPDVIDPVQDFIRNYQHAQCFAAISGSPQTVQAVRDILRTNSLPPGQNPINVNALFEQYGF